MYALVLVWKKFDVTQSSSTALAHTTANMICNSTGGATR